MLKIKSLTSADFLAGGGEMGALTQLAQLGTGFDYFSGFCIA
jgi:hypothetical protein